jgi:hypothetical protein
VRSKFYEAQSNLSLSNLNSKNYDIMCLYELYDEVYFVFLRSIRGIQLLIFLTKLMKNVSYEVQ